MSDRPMGISSCGHYKLINMEKFHTVRPNGRKDWQLLYMVSGVFEYSDGKSCFELNAPCIILYSPGEYQNYSYRLCTKSEVYWVHFAGYDCKNILNGLGLFTDTGSHLLLPKANHRLLFDKIIQELQLKRPFFSNICDGLLFQLLGSFARNISELKNGKISDEIRKAVEYFNSNYTTDISVGDYARSIGMSHSHFCHLFKKEMKESPTEYLRILKIDAAKELLNSTDMTISQIAYSLGFSDPLYFSRVFSAKENLSPKSYRQQKLSKKL